MGIEKNNTDDHRLELINGFPHLSASYRRQAGMITDISQSVIICEDDAIEAGSAVICD